MTIMCYLCAGWFVLSAICSALFWAAAVLAGRDDDMHGREE